MTMSHCWNILVDTKERFSPNLWPKVELVYQVSWWILLHLWHIWHIYDIAAKMFFDALSMHNHRWQSVFLPFWCSLSCFPPLSLTLCLKPIWWLTLLSSNGSHVDSIQLRSRLYSSQPLEYQFFQFSQPNNTRTCAHTHRDQPNSLVVRKAVK